jgi:hypothetical protein
LAGQASRRKASALFGFDTLPSFFGIDPTSLEELLSEGEVSVSWDHFRCEREPPCRRPLRRDLKLTQSAAIHLYVFGGREAEVSNFCALLGRRPATCLETGCWDWNDAFHRNVTFMWNQLVPELWQLRGETSDELT